MSDKKWNMEMRWLPEAQPKYSGVYAPANYVAGENTMTKDPWDAMQFTTREACQTWCDANPVPYFTPVEHGFAVQGGPVTTAKLTLYLEIPYPDDSVLLSDKVAALLRDIADHSEKSARMNGQNPEGAVLHFPDGSVSWARTE